MVLLMFWAHDKSIHQMLTSQQTHIMGNFKTSLQRIRLQLMCFHKIPFSQPSSLLLIFTPFTACQNLRCLPTLSLLSGSTAAMITAEHRQAELQTAERRIHQDRPETEEKLLI